MSEADQVPSETASSTLHPSRRLFYAPWMIGVLVVFMICEGVFIAWGHEAFGYAVVGLLSMVLFILIRFYRVYGEGCVALMLLIAFVIFLALLLPAGKGAIEAARRVSCISNLKLVGLGIHNYLEEYKQFPPAFVADETGQPMHSWRTLLLPFWNDIDLYERYDFQKPWNSPENQTLFVESGYRPTKCPSVDDSGRPKYRTDYVAVVGDDTIWPADGTSRSRKEVSAGLSNVALVIDINNSDILFAEPRDVKLEDLLSGKVSWSGTSPHTRCSAFYLPVPSRNVLFADGRVSCFYGSLTPDQIRRLFSITEPFDVEKELPRPARRPIVYRHVVFYIWLVTLLLQFVYIFFPVTKEV